MFGMLTYRSLSLSVYVYLLLLYLCLLLFHVFVSVYLSYKFPFIMFKWRWDCVCIVLGPSVLMQTLFLFHHFQVNYFCANNATDIGLKKIAWDWVNDKSQKLEHTQRWTIFFRFCLINLGARVCQLIVVAGYLNFCKCTLSKQIWRSFDLIRELQLSSLNAIKIHTKQHSR